MKRLVLLAVLATAGLLVFCVHHVLSTPPDRLEQKVVSAGRYLYYRVDASRRPRFELSGDEHTLRLVSHARVAGDYDPARELVYGLRLEILAEGRPLWSHEVYLRSRQSKARHVDAHGGLWLDENAFSLEPGVEVTDDRQLVVRLPEDVPEGAELRLAALGDTPEVDVRLYAQVERSARKRQLRLRTLSAGEREALAEQVGNVPWDRLTTAERLARLRLAELRLPALGREGIDYETRVLYDTGFRRPGDGDDEPRGFLVEPGRPVAVNVLGPARLQLASDATVHVEPGLDVPAGWHTLVVRSDERARVELSRDGAPVLPDETVLPGYLVDADTAVEIDVSGLDALGRSLRVDARLVDGAEAELRFETVGDRGIVAAGHTSLIGPAAPFERLETYGQVSHVVSEPIALGFVVPRGGQRLRLSASRPVFVRVAAPVADSPPPAELAAPLAPVDGFTWRYPRLARHNWFALRAANHAGLAPTHTARLAAQPRLEPRGDREPTPLVAAQALAPDGRAEKQTVIEHIAADDEARVRAHWTRGDQTRVVPNQPVSLDFSAGEGRPRISYWVLGDAMATLGTPVEILVDGKPTGRPRLSTGRGDWDLPRLAGRHTLLVRTRASGLRLLVDRPGAGELFALRTLHRLARPLRVRVAKSHGATKLNVVVYTATPDEPVRLHVAIDGGAPRRVEGRALADWTAGERTLELPAASREATVGFANQKRRGALWPRRVVVSLGDDLPAGGHTVELAAEGGGARWARFFVLGGARRPREQAVSWRARFEDEP